MACGASHCARYGRASCLNRDIVRTNAADERRLLQYGTVMLNADAAMMKQMRIMHFGSCKRHAYPQQRPILIASEKAVFSLVSDQRNQTEDHRANEKKFST
jgi:hypothetical protein